MNNLRLWLVLLALVAFLAGLAAGVWITAARTRPEPLAGAFEDYHALLSSTFSLSPERQKHLRTILENYARDLDEIKDRHLATYMSAMEKELEDRGSYYRNLIQERVLPENQRASFVRLASSLPTNHP